MSGTTPGQAERDELAAITRDAVRATQIHLNQLPCPTCDPRIEMVMAAADAYAQAAIDSQQPQPAPDSVLIAVREGSAPMSLHFSDADPVAECHVKDCRWHGHGDSLNDAVTAWTRHLNGEHRGDWE